MRRARKEASVIPQGWFTYVLQCGDGTLYTGATNNIENRMQKHREGRGAKYTRGRMPIQVLYVNWHDSKGGALEEERRIKRMSRVEKFEHITDKSGRRDSW